jgi:hypothetical protein
MNRDDALADRIVDFVKQGRIPQRFGVQHVREHFGDQYSEKHIMTVLPNFAVGGYWVKKGQKARFKRVRAEKGLYELASSLDGPSSDKRSQRPPASPGILTADDLGAMRRRLIRLLDCVEKKAATHSEGVARRVSRLRDKGVVPRNIANWMQTILSARGGTEYEGHKLSQNESDAIRAAWAEVSNWDKTKGCNPNGST